MKLIIDSRSNTHLSLQIADHKKLQEFASPRDQDVLVAIEQFLSDLNIKLEDITEIEVKTGPGTFTSLRAGIAIAQGLSFALQIPINGKPAGSVVQAEYGKAPNITPLAITEPSR